jgi:hypothetical protein
MIAIAWMCGWLAGATATSPVSAFPLFRDGHPADATETFRTRYGVPGKLEVVSGTVDDRSASDGPVNYRMECKLLRPGTYIFHFREDIPFGKGSESHDFRIVFPKPAGQAATRPADEPEFVLVGDRKPADRLSVVWSGGNGAQGPWGWNLESIGFEPAP